MIVIRFTSDPHVFAIAANAMAQLLDSSRSQIVLVSGESGSGKTETAKYLLRWITAYSGSPTMLLGNSADPIANASLEDRILAATPILEAFGNARTVRNRNSSRFGKLIKIFFERNTGKLRGAAIESYLLEKPRVTHLSDNDTNYHVFYYLLAGASADVRARLQLQQRTATDFRYLLAAGQSSARQGFDNDAGMFQELLEAFRVCGVSDEERAHIFDILGAILHLGNCEFVFVKEAKRLAPAQRPVLGTAARLLQIDPTTLEKALTTRLLGSKSRASTYSVPLDAAGVAEARESVARVLYNSLFHWLVDRINRMLSANHAVDDRFVAILDIFGFENFAHNSFEQLLINYANEKLHDSFLESVFREEQRTYEAEGLQWQSVSLEDNSACLTLLEQRPSGILALLDEECLLPTGSDDGYLRKAELAHAQSRHFATPRAVSRNARAERGFVIKHFADDVTYAVADFVEKNQDRLHADLVIALQSSKNPFICAMLSDDMDEGGDAASRASRSTTVRRQTSAAGANGANGATLATNARKRPTQATMFRSQLDELCRMIQSVDRHFIRCVKPNAASTPGYIDEPMLRAQLRYTGVVAAARVRAAGYALRLPFAEFVERFKSTTAAELAGLDARAASATIAQSVCAMSSPRAGAGELFQIGRTRVFLKQIAVDMLEEARLRLRRQLALEVQCAMRAALARSLFEQAQAEHRRRIAEERRRREEEERRRQEEERRRRAEEEERRRREEEERQRRIEEDARRRREDDEQQRRRRDEEEQRRRREDDERRVRDSSARMGDRSPVTSQRQDDIYVGLPQKQPDERASSVMQAPYDPVPPRESYVPPAVVTAADKSNYSSAPRSQSLAVRNAAQRSALEYVQLGPEEFAALEREAQYTIIPPEDDDDDNGDDVVSPGNSRRGLFDTPQPVPIPADLQYVVIAPEDDVQSPPAPKQARWQNAIADVLNDLQYVVMPPEEVLTTLPPPDAESFDLQYVVMPPEEAFSSPPSGRSPRQPRGPAGAPPFELQYIIMPPEESAPTRAAPSDVYVSAPGRPTQVSQQSSGLRVFDTEEGASSVTLNLPNAMLARDAMAELGRLFNVDDFRRFGLFMTQFGTTPPIKVRLDDDIDVGACLALLSSTGGSGAASVRTMFLENARFAGTASLWTRETPPAALASAWAMQATSGMPAGGAGGSIGSRPRLKRTVVNKNLGDDERVGTIRGPSGRASSVAGSGGGGAAVVPGGVYGALDVSPSGMMRPSSPPQRSLSPTRGMTQRQPTQQVGANGSVRLASPPLSPERSLSPARSRPGPRLALPNAGGGSPAPAPQVSPRRDRGFSEPDAMIRPVQKRPTEPMTVMRSGRSLYTSAGANGAAAAAADTPPPLSPPGQRGATLAKKQVVIGNQVHLIDQVPPSPEPHRRRDNSVPLMVPEAAAPYDGAVSPRRSDSVPANGTLSPGRPGEMLASIRDRYGLGSAPADELLSALVESKFIRCTPRNSSLVIKAGSLRGSLLMLFSDVLLFGDPTTEIRALQVAECVVTPGVGTDLSCRIGNGSPDGDIRLQFENENERHVWVSTLMQACNAAREREPLGGGGDAKAAGRTRGRTLKSMLSKGGNASVDLLTAVTADWRFILEQCRDSVGPTSRPWHLVISARLHALCLALPML